MKPIPDNRRKNAAVVPKPEWAEAAMILALYKIASLEEKLTGKPSPAQLTISLADLERFCELKTNNHTLMSLDKVAETVTIRSPECILPKCKLAFPEKKIISELN